MIFENIRSDFQTYQGHIFEPGFFVMVVYRFGRWKRGIRPAFLRFPFTLVYKIFYRLAQILTGIDLPCETKVGTGLRIWHFGSIIISDHVELGNHVTLRTGVVIGHNHPGETAWPIIGNGVDIGVGAKILGPVHVGDNVKIGANAVVITDIPANATAVGVPARIILHEETSRVGFLRAETQRERLPKEMMIPRRMP